MAEDRVRHNHVTRDIKPVGMCPACDRYWSTAPMPGPNAVGFDPFETEEKPVPGAQTDEEAGRG